MSAQNSRTKISKRIENFVQGYRKSNRSADRWAKGQGVIRHSPETQYRVFQMAEILKTRQIQADEQIFDYLYAADRVTSAAMWIVVHETYARNVYLDGRDLTAKDFKPNPEGHTGGALNMVPAYVGYMTINAITGITRAWVMGQGHCVAAIDTVNLLLDNMVPAHRSRYSISDEGLTRYVRDFYSYKIGPDGRQDSPLGSHVNAHTAGGVVEGGYLGFTELQYVHMTLPGERLVAFLSDGAFEEQRGSDWVPRWWRAEDCGLVIPIMIKNGRRIDQRTTMSQQGGVNWLVRHLRLNEFDPIVFDGRDPAAFAWAIFEMERRLAVESARVLSGKKKFPVKLPYGIAVAPKGAGFYGEGTNLAHNLPLMANPSVDKRAAENFNLSARKLFVPKKELMEATEKLKNHWLSGRPKEKDHPLVDRRVWLKKIPSPVLKLIPENRKDRSKWKRSSPMTAIDKMFVRILKANPEIRPRVGNPDEMRSNRLTETLEYLKFRVTDPEPGLPEDVHGHVITALNEEAVACAALANKGGINLIHTYEAFGTKMHGALRQEIIFADHCNESGRVQEWLSIPLILTSHTWENAKNERSHQDPSMAEAMMVEPSDISRVLFIPDFNTAAVIMERIYQTHGQVWTLVVPKLEVIPDLFTREEAERLLDRGAIRLDWAGYRVEDQRVVLTAIGAYQLEEVLKASFRLSDRGFPHSVVYMLEPGRFRYPRNERENRHLASQEYMKYLYPYRVISRIFVTHTRPEIILGMLQSLNTGKDRKVGLGFINKGGTLNVPGMIFVNRCSWAHIVDKVTEIFNLVKKEFLTEDEIAAIQGLRSPEEIIYS